MNKDERQQREWERNYADAKLDRVALAVSMFRIKGGSARTLSMLGEKYGIRSADVKRLVMELFRHRNPGVYKICGERWRNLRQMRDSFLTENELDKEISFDHAKTSHS